MLRNSDYEQQFILSDYSQFLKHAFAAIIVEKDYVYLSNIVDIIANI